MKTGHMPACMHDNSAATDTLGVPLFAESMKDVWEEQRQHVKCLQDPQGVQLYTITGHLNKGGITILRCARGSTSLESFHRHIARFIPGSSANLCTQDSQPEETRSAWAEEISPLRPCNCQEVNW